MLPQFSEKEKKRAEQAVYRHIIKDYNSRGDLGSASRMVMPKDLQHAILYESTFDECTWGESDWASLSGNGSRFTDCDFYASKINNAALQHALFDSAVFHHCEMRGSNFAYSLFAWSVINGSEIESSSFTGAEFNHVMLQDCKIEYSNFELCKFRNTEFRNISFKNLTLKYTFFRDVHMENVELPFMQMPYTFGGMKYIFTTEDSIKIVSMSKRRPNLSVAEYRSMLPKLIVFFSSQGDYFPLSNCYLANGQRKLAEQANEAGIVNSAALHDFRKLYFYCIQATQELDLSRERRSQLYDRIRQIIASNQLSRAEYHEFRHYFPMIKQLMFDNPYSHPTLAVSLHTNIGANDFHSLGLLMRTLDEVSENCGAKLDSKHIEIRHNSPNIVGWFPTGNLGQLLQLLQNTWEVISPVLPDALQNAANAVTLVTGAFSVYRFMKPKNPSQPNNKQVGEKASAKREKAEKSTDKPAAIETEMSAEQIQVLHLRNELLKREQAWRKDEHSTIFPFPHDTAAVKRKFNERTKELLAAGIRIESLEIQLLDDSCDALDSLHYRETESV